MAPTPQPSNTGQFKGLTLNVPDSGSGKTPDLFGLGAWRDQTVNPGDLPILGSLVTNGKATTAQDVVQAFAHGKPEEVATIQHALAMSGYYSSNYTPKWGVISEEDIRAFRSAVTTAGQAGQSVSDLLTTQAEYGARAGLQAAQQQTQQQKSQVAQVNVPNTADLEATAEAAFRKVLDRKPTPQEAARFAAFYRSIVTGVQRANNQTVYDATNPQLTGPLATINPDTAIGDVTSTPDTHGMTRVGGARGNEGVEFVPNTQPGPALSFSDKVGGLMTLGQAVNQSISGPAGGLTQVEQQGLPDASVAAVNFARNANPKEAAATDTASVFDTFLGLLSKNFG